MADAVSIPVLYEQSVTQTKAWKVVEICERAAAALLLAVTTPIILTSALVIRIVSGRTPFIAHKRVGWRGSVLWMVKLRTMWDSSLPSPPGAFWIEYINDEAGPSRKQLDDDRVPHAFARFCRRHSIDEFPQLWHVVRGEMALVGPRPITRGEMHSHYGGAAREVLALKPGIAGLWQVSGRNRLTYDARKRLDLEYVRNRSAALYCRILLLTIVEVWTADAW